MYYLLSIYLTINRY